MIIDPTLIIKPVITEKATKLESKGKYQLYVRRDATKIQVKTLFEKLYGVKVAKMNVARTSPKYRVAGRRSATIKKPEYKKITLTVKNKQLVDITKPKLKA